jgi:hypothetical protein
MVERQLPKLHTRVRFPSPAPVQQTDGGRAGLECGPRFVTAISGRSHASPVALPDLEKIERNFPGAATLALASVALGLAVAG